VSFPLEVRPLRPDETQELLAFYRGNFPAGQRVATLFEWRAGAPFGTNAPWGAWLEGELLGTVNAVRCPLVADGARMEACWQQDSIVSPAARGKGVGKALVESAAAGYPLVMAKGTTQAMYGLRKSVGFNDAPNDTYLFRVLRPWNVRGSWRRRVAAPLLFLRAKALAPPAPGIAVRPTGSFGPHYDALAEQLTASPGWKVWKPAAYLSWRYLACPIRRYRILEAHRAERTIGAAVLRLDERMGSDAWLVDLIVDLGDRPAVLALIEAAAAEARQSGAALLRTFASSGRARKLLAEAGFIDTRDTPHFTFRPNGVAESVLPPVAEWSFWHGDGDAELYQ